MLCARANAEVRLSGNVDKVVLQANNATMDEVLSDLRATFNLRIELAGSMDRQFTGVYSGSVRRVLTRLLDGQDYVINAAGGGMTIMLVGRKGAMLPAGGAGEPVNAEQGWTGAPKFPVSAKVEPDAAANAADTAKPQAGDARQPTKLAANDDETSNPLQGWTGSAIKFVVPQPATIPPAGDGAALPNEQPEENSAVQGWVPSGNRSPLSDPDVKLAPALTDAPSGEDEGNPDLQGYMPGWEPPEPGNSIRDALPMMPGAMTPGPMMPRSIAPGHGQ